MSTTATGEGGVEDGQCRRRGAEFQTQQACEQEGSARHEADRRCRPTGGRCDAAHRDPQDGELRDRNVGPSYFPAADRRRCGHPRGQPLPPLRVQGSHPRRADQALPRRPRPRRRDRAGASRQARPPPRLRTDHRAWVCDRPLRGRASGRPADVVLRGSELRPRADGIDTAPAVDDPGRDVAGASGRALERLHPIRPGPSHPGRPRVPEHAACRSGRHPTQGIDGRTGHVEEPDNSRGSRSRRPLRCGPGQVERIRGR